MENTQHRVAAPDVVVVGSVHMDLLARSARMPELNEAVVGDRYSLYPGGKGGNQAIAAARQGASTALISRVGSDAFGEQVRVGLHRKGVDLTYLLRDPDVPTGVSPILAAANGDTASIIIPGAARRLLPRDLVPARAFLRSCRLLILQLEIPFETSATAAQIAHGSGALVMLNASPSEHLTTASASDIWDVVDLLVVNRHEAQILSDRSIDGWRDGIDAATVLKARFALRAVVVTLGAVGAVMVCEDGEVFVPAAPAAVVDTVGAGDAAAGALAAAMVRGERHADALRFAVAAGALAVQSEGAFDAAPTLAATRAHLASIPASMSR